MHKINKVCAIRLYRLAAYRQFTNWTYNFLGKGNRRVVPACVVKTVRLKFPEPQYTGFKAAELTVIVNCIYVYSK